MSRERAPREATTRRPPAAVQQTAPAIATDGGTARTAFDVAGARCRRVARHPASCYLPEHVVVLAGVLVLLVVAVVVPAAAKAAEAAAAAAADALLDVRELVVAREPGERRRLASRAAASRAAGRFDSQW